MLINVAFDGHYYVVEAVTNANTKRDVVLSAFIEEVGKEIPRYKELFNSESAYHVANAFDEQSNPSPNVQDGRENNAFESQGMTSSVSNVPENSETVNTEVPHVENAGTGNTEVPNIDRQYQPQGGETYVSQTATNTGRRSETFFNQSKESAEFLDKEMAKDRFTKIV